MKKTILLLLLVCGTMTVFAQRDDDASRQRDLYARATDLYQKQKYAAAQQIFDHIAANQHGRADVTTAEAAYYAAVCSERLNNDDGHYRLEEFLRLYPQSEHCNMARFYLGNFFYTRAKYDRALSYYRQVDASDVEYDHRSEYNFKMGYCYFQKGDTKHAANLFAQQIGGESKYRTSSLYYYAHIQYANGQYDLALKNFKELENDKKFSKIAPSYIARIYYYLGKEDELLQLAPSLLASDDAFKKEEIHQMVAETYFGRGEYRKALEQYDAVAQMGAAANIQSCTPQDNDYQIGYCYYMLKQYDKAEQYLSKKAGCGDTVAQNALFVLADCCLKKDRKMEARNMFHQASEMNYDKNLQEEALFNYAKLSLELNQNAMGESIKTFEGYLKSYPKSKHKTEVQEMLTDLYCNTKNYKDAIAMLEKIPSRNATLEQAYQRAVLNRGIELCNSGKESEGKQHYEKAIKINAVPRLTAEASYLLGELQFAAGDFPHAEQNINRFLLSSFAKTSPNLNNATYTYGYLLMRLKKYDLAQESFEQLLKNISKPKNEQETTMCNDATNRLADCLYMQSRFPQSITQYGKVIEANATDADYATYQTALAYGAQGKNSQKLTYLNYVFEKYPKSSLRSQALFEIANTYLSCDNNEMAMTYYDNFIKLYPKSKYVKQALLNKGLIYYNTDRDEQALQCFDQLLREYPGTEEAHEVLTTIKNIYVAQGRIEEYFDYVRNTTKVNVSTVEQDSITYLAAEQKYQRSQFESAAASFENYLNKFPNGLFSLKAHYFLADCLFRLGKNASALPHYEAVVEAGTNQYSERSMVNAANIAYNLGQYGKASQYYYRMRMEAESDNILLHGLIGSIRCAATLQNHRDVIQTGEAILNEKKATTELKEEAYLLMARSCFDDRLIDSAAMYYSHIEESTNGEYNGEARCREIEILIGQKKYDEAEKMIENVVSDATSDYWLAYSFILWADVYYARGNNLQAKQTLQSIIDNYDGEELVEVALKKKATIEAEEQKETKTEEKEVEIEL